MLLLMSEQEIIMEYVGEVNHKLIDNLLKKLKRSKEYMALDITTARRLYAIVVECLENITKHSEKLSSSDEADLPHITIQKQGDHIIIKSGNPILKIKVEAIAEKLDTVNRKNEKSLTGFYEKVINEEMAQKGNNAGLGFIIMKLKSGDNINLRKLVIDQTSSSPRVMLDPEKKIFEISGESRPPDVGSFYGEILTWMDDYSGHILKSQEGREPIVFSFDLEYFNSSSAKYILDLCKLLSSIRSKGKEVEVKWHYENDDMDMLEVGREMSRMAKLPFEFVKKA